MYIQVIKLLETEGAPEVADSGGPPAHGRWGQSATGNGCRAALKAALTITDTTVTVSAAAVLSTHQYMKSQNQQAKISFATIDHCLIGSIINERNAQT